MESSIFNRNRIYKNIQGKILIWCTKGSIFTVSIPANQHLKEEIINKNKSEILVPDEQTPEEKVILEEKLNKLSLMFVVDDNEDFRNFISAL